MTSNIGIDLNRLIDAHQYPATSIYYHGNISKDTVVVLKAYQQQQDNEYLDVVINNINRKLKVPTKLNKLHKVLSELNHEQLTKEELETCLGNCVELVEDLTSNIKWIISEITDDLQELRNEQ